MLRRRSLGYKLATIYLLLAVPLTTAAAYSYYDRYRVRIRESLQRRSDFAHLVGATFELYVNEIRVAMDMVGREVLEEGGVPALEDLRVLTDGYPAAFAVALDPSGRVALATDTAVSQLDLSRHAAFRPLLSGEATEALTAGEDVLGTRGFYISRATYAQDGSAAAVLGVFIDVSRLHEALPFGSPHVAASVVDPNGGVVYQTEFVRLAQTGADFGRYPFVRTALEGGHGSTTGFVSPVSGTRRHAAAEPIGGTGWVAVSSVERAEAIGPILRSMWLSFGIALAATVLALVTSLGVLHGMLASLYRLVEVSGRIGRGDFSMSPGIRTGDEFEQLSHALDDAREHLRLQVDALASLARAGRSLSRTLEEEEVASAVGEAARELLGGMRTWVLLGRPEDPRLERFLWPEDWTGETADQAQELSRDALRGSATRCVEVPEARGDRAREYGMVLVAAPLMVAGRTFGVLGLACVGRRGWEAGSRGAWVLEALTAQVALAIQNARRYGTERRIAGTLQTALLQLPERIEGVVFDRVYRSATRAAFVGGDFYDLFPLGEGRFGVLLGDVSGKGLQAATLTAMAKHTIRAYAAEHGASPAKVLALTGDVLFSSTATETFVTVFFGLLDAERRSLVYASAGHPPAMLRRQGGTIEGLAPTGPIAGAFRDSAFHERTVPFLPGEVLVVYTDGLIEERNADGEQFGEERVRAHLASALSADTGARRLLEALEAFTGGTHGDDVAIMTVGLDARRAGSS
ncbi:MAG: SpoIIE family protein phosphatase [Coriobacteriia bacterium]|nr:SpoIIE family protein phosphatase [Coriobacteriia bacterium]